jgi:hypothetical protein
MKAVCLSLGAAVLLTQIAVAGHLTRSQRVEQNGMNQMLRRRPCRDPSKDRRAWRSRCAAVSRQAGFTNLKVMPESFLIRAQDPHGNNQKSQ